MSAIEETKVAATTPQTTEAPNDDKTPSSETDVAVEVSNNADDAQQNPTSDESRVLSLQEPIDGPRNMQSLLDVMSERQMDSKDIDDFSVEFVAQFYADKDYTAGKQSMYNGEPTDWGKTYWNFIHFISYYYPEEPSDSLKRAVYQQLDAFRETLPCENCRRAFRMEILTLPLEEFLDSRETLIEWAIELHSRVNKRLGHKEFDTDATYKQLTERSTAAAEKQKASKSRENAKTQTQRQPKSTNSVPKHRAAPQIASDAAKARREQAQRMQTSRRQISARETAQTMRNVLQRRAKLNPRQLAAVVAKDRQRAAKKVRKPSECASCKPMVASTF